MNCSNIVHIYNIPVYNVVSWQKQVNRGLFMKGAIKARKDAVCPRCKSSSFKNVFDDFINYSVPKCTKCFGPPNLIKVTKHIPDFEGNSIVKDFYRDLDEQPITKISQAIALIGKINDQLKDGTYKPQEYDIKTIRRLKFSNYAKEYIEISKWRYGLPEGHEQRIKKKSLDQIINLIENYLAPFFKEMPIDKIQKEQILAFKRSFTDKVRTRDLSLGLLRTMLRFAFNELGLIDRVPPFQKIPKARSLRVDEIPTKDIQVQIINAIDKDKYRVMFILMATLGIRPSEARAYKVGDVDLISKRITAQRHFSRNDLEDGRKSIDQDDSMGILVHKLDANLIKLITPYVLNRGPDEFLFKGERGPYVCESAIWEAWDRASKKLGVKKYRPYAGTKSASATDMIKNGKSIESVRALLGHKNSKTTEIYAKIAAIDTNELIDSSMFTVGSHEVLGNGTTGKVINFKR
jgi:integrase